MSMTKADMFFVGSRKRFGAALAGNLVANPQHVVQLWPSLKVLMGFTGPNEISTLIQGSASRGQPCKVMGGCLRKLNGAAKTVISFWLLFEPHRKERSWSLVLGSPQVAHELN